MARSRNDSPVISEMFDSAEAALALGGHLSETVACGKQHR
jgi:hypothetical protein